MLEQRGEQRRIARSFQKKLFLHFRSVQTEPSDALNRKILVDQSPPVFEIVEIAEGAAAPIHIMVEVGLATDSDRRVALEDVPQQRCSTSRRADYENRRPSHAVSVHYFVYVFSNLFRLLWTVMVPFGSAETRSQLPSSPCS